MATREDTTGDTEKELAGGVELEESSTEPTAESRTEDTELDDLLDSALEDFDKCKPAEADTSKNEEQAKNPPLPTETTPTLPPQIPPNMESLFGDFLNCDTAAEATAEFERAMQAIMSDISNETGEDPALAEQLQKLVESANSGAPMGLPMGPPTAGSPGASAGSGAEINQALGETMSRLAQNAEELKGGNFSEEELLKSMGNLNFDDDAQGDMNFMPMMQAMMQNLLSKEVLYPSIKEIVEKYPKWLEENKDKGNQEDYRRYEKQYGAMKTLADEYESESSTDSDDTKKQRFERIMKSVQEMESLGQPPKELVGTMAPGLEFDEQGNPKLPGLPSPDQCVVM